MGGRVCCEWTVTCFRFADNLPRNTHPSTLHPPPCGPVIWFTSFFIAVVVILFISLPFRKEFTWVRRQAATKCWPDVRLRFFFFFHLLSLSAVYPCPFPPAAVRTLIILLKQISTLKLITLMKSSPRLCSVLSLAFPTLFRGGNLILAFFGFEDILLPQFPLPPKNILLTVGILRLSSLSHGNLSRLVGRQRLGNFLAYFRFEAFSISFSFFFFSSRFSGNAIRVYLLSGS